MSNNNKGKLFVIVAPSGTGKSTLINRLKSEIPRIEESVSHTTRPKRRGEKEGVNYFYVSKAEFLKLDKNDEFLETAVVHSNYYGTSKKFVQKKISQGAMLLFDLDVQGADFFKEKFGEDARVIFLEPPSIEELEHRLTKRGTESLEVIKERISNAKKELQSKDKYDYRVKNADLELAFNELKKIFTREIEH